MRKMLILLMAVILLFSMSPALGEDEYVTMYQSSFSVNNDGWYGRGSAVLTRGMNLMHVEGRTSNWNSPGRDFDLAEGYPYLISVQVRQSDLDSAEFMISVAHGLDGTETYENIARAQVKKDAWTTLTGTYTPGHFDHFVLYVETVNAPELSFDFRIFKVQASPAAPTPKPETAQAIYEAYGEMPALKDVYADLFDFGTALPQSATTNIELMKFVRSQFNIITPENELKPDSVLDVAASKKLAQEDETAVAVRFNAVKNLLNFAKASGIKVHGHVLVWHSQTPETFFHEEYDASKPYVSREVMLARLENYIREVMDYMDENYPGLIVSWDVVNEAIDDSTNKLRESNWTKVVGQDFVERAFEYARKYAPEGTLLYYNDYNSAMPAKMNGIIRILEPVIAEGNIDGYGFQMHHGLNFPSNDAIAKSLERIAALGLKIRVSELDVTIPDNTEATLQKQARKYANIMRMLKPYAGQLMAVQVWGVTDNMSWRASQFPLLFYRNLQPKPAFWAVADPDSAR